MMGYTREEVVGKKPFSLGFWHDPDDRRKLDGLAKMFYVVQAMKARYR